MSLSTNFSAAPGNLQAPSASVLNPAQNVSSPVVVNGVQPSVHQNGVSANGTDFEEIIQLNNSGSSGNPSQQQSGLVSEPIMAFEGGEPFLMKTGPMKPQHVAGTETQHQTGM